VRDFEVWDYSALNVQDLLGMGVAATHVPMGYAPEMTRLRDDFPSRTEVLFYGLITERRQALISRLASQGVHILASQEAFGDLRDRLLAHSRLVLNIHQFLPARLEVVRLGYVWANKKAVLSERRSDTEIPEYLCEACRFAEYDDIPSVAQELLGDPAKLKQQAEAGFAAFASRPMDESLEKIIGRRIFAGSGQEKSSAPDRSTQAAPYHIQAAPEWLITGDWSGIGQARA
jgi:hypothetical protein